MSEPRKVELRQDGGLSILWDDRHPAIYSGRALRLACRCALCEDEWSGARRLEAAQVPEGVVVREVKPVGRYGLQLAFSDGHNTGIYTFNRLRGLCECPGCPGGAVR
ncbi:MAG TPA: DUF971 domain-containing protein [Candidatus Polarisedimenticolia bacterium]